MKDLSFEQIDRAVEIIAELGKEYGLIKQFKITIISSRGLALGYFLNKGK